MRFTLPFTKIPKKIFLLALVSVIAGLLILAAYKISTILKQNQELLVNKVDLETQITKIQTDLTNLENQDQIKINKDLKEEIANIHNTLQKALKTYELLDDLGLASKNMAKLQTSFANILSLLSNQKWQEAETKIAELNSSIEKEKQLIAASVKIPANVAQINTPPDAGYRRQKVKIDSGEFLVDIISADLNSTKVIVDTASDSTCANDCPVLPLADYVSRSGAYAGVNGSYFCPSTYPQCAGKTNSFDTLLMNKNKVYFNSDNNVYSSVPAAIFYGSSARFVAQSSEWGRDTGVDAVIANQPLLVLGGQVRFGGDDDAKHTSKGNRSFIGNKGSTVYIGVVHSATVVESARVLAALGLENALNLDDGGSTALWSGGYKVGPGRNIPNAVLLVKK